MKKAAFITVLFSIITIVHAQDVNTLQTGWKFAKGQNDSAFQKDFDDSQWRDVTVPHDWGIEGPVIADGDGNTGKLPWKGEGWYRKSVDIPLAYSQKEVYLL